MKVTRFEITGPVLVEPAVHGDARGYFVETYHAARLKDALGFDPEFVQDNLSKSEAVGTLRGMHLQLPPFAQHKFVTCIAGEIMDVVTDVRKGSPTYGKHVSVNLRAGTGAALFVPAGFLHGFVTRSADTIVSYKVSAHYDRDSDISVAWNDPDLGIDWGLGGKAPVLSGKDQTGIALASFESPFGYAA